MAKSNESQNATAEGGAMPPENPPPTIPAPETAPSIEPTPPATAAPDPVTGENKLKELADEFNKTKPTATPEGKKDAAEKKKRGRPPKNPAPGVTTSPDNAPSFDPEDIERAANSTAEQLMLMTAMGLGDMAFLPASFSKGMTSEESIRAAWKAYYKRYGVKEMHPALMIAFAHGTHILGTYMGNKRVKKRVKGRFRRLFDKAKGLVKGALMKMKGEI